MTQDSRINHIVFAEEKLKKTFDRLKKGRSEEKELYELINRAFDDLKKDPFVGTKIQTSLWPKEYVKKYEINNLWKYNLPNGWRLIYTVKASSVEIVSIILEWFDHKSYERRFGY
ncbi:MAG: hypothetical protein V1909_02345 [Candidatus Micrarchaeota archaeon]